MAERAGCPGRGSRDRSVTGVRPKWHGSVTELRPRHRDAGNSTRPPAFLMPSHRSGFWCGEKLALYASKAPQAPRRGHPGGADPWRTVTRSWSSHRPCAVFSRTPHVLGASWGSGPARVPLRRPGHRLAPALAWTARPGSTPAPRRGARPPPPRNTCPFDPLSRSSACTFGPSRTSKDRSCRGASRWSRRGFRARPRTDSSPHPYRGRDHAPWRNRRALRPPAGRHAAGARSPRGGRAGEHELLRLRKRAVGGHGGLVRFVVRQAELVPTFLAFRPEPPDPKPIGEPFRLLGRGVGLRQPYRPVEGAQGTLVVAGVRPRCRRPPRTTPHNTRRDRGPAGTPSRRSDQARASPR